MTSQQNLQDLFSSADAGLSAKTTEILINNIDNQTALAANGVSPVNLDSNDVTIVSVLLDATGSLKVYENEVIQSYNTMLNALKGSKTANNILLSSWLFNTKSELLHSFLGLDQCTTLNNNNYRPWDQTALYDAVLDAINGVVAYSQMLRNNGINTKIVLVALTDGEDNFSRTTATQLKSVVEDLKNKEIYTFALVEFGQHNTNIGDEIGFPNTIHYGATASEIRKALGQISASIIKASQTIIGSNNTTGFFS